MTHQTEAQRLAALLRSRNNNQAGFGLGPVCDEAAIELLRLNSVHADLERVSMQLVACGVVAMADTPDSAKKARAMHPDYESASCDDVKRRVDECIALRARVAELEDVLANLPLSSPQRLRARIQRLEEMLAAVGAGGVGPLIPAAAQHQRESGSDNELQRKTGDLITTAALPQTGGVPPDWKLVPVKPTRGMLDAARKDLVRDAEIDPMLKGIHSAMLAAAPQPPVVGQSDNDTVPVPRSLLGAACAAINRKQDAPKLLEQLRRYTTGDLSTPAAAPQQGEQEPVAWMCTETRVLYDTDTRQVDKHHGFKPTVPLYTHSQPPRQPLTDEQIAEVLIDETNGRSTGIGFKTLRAFARAIERAHGVGGEA